MAKKIKNLQELLTSSGIKGEVVDHEVSFLVAPGENFGSIMLKVDITLKKDKNIEILHAVAKCVPPNPMTQEIFHTEVTFKNEIRWYSTVIPEFIAFQKECGFEQTADFFQKFYGARISLDPKSDVVDLDGLLLTENLVTKGYKVYDRQEGFDLETAKLILKDLAVFHGVFMGLKNQKPEVFEGKIRPCLKGFNPAPPPEDAPNPFLKLFDVLAENQELAPLVPRLKKSHDTYNPFSTTPGSEDGIWNTVSHNDLWTNNIMIKEGPPKQAIFLDLQVTQYKSVAKDVIFFLLTSLQINVFHEHYDQLLIHYYDNFIETLKQVQFDVSDYSFEKFLAEINYQAEHGELVHAFFHTIFLMADKNTEGRKYAAEDGNDMMGDVTRLIEGMTKKHFEKYRFLILEGVKQKWI